MTARLLPEKRLEILQRLDPERQWYALDDKRLCGICEQVFTGRQIEIQRDPRGHYLLKCPTVGCTSAINHWYLCELSPARHNPPGRIIRRGDFSFMPVSEA